MKPGAKFPCACGSGATSSQCCMFRRRQERTACQLVRYHTNHILHERHLKHAKPENVARLVRFLAGRS